MNLSCLRNGAKALFHVAVERSPLGGTLFWHGPRGGVALTFDDGPDPEGTPRILDQLAQRGASATFFLVGEQARRYPELVRRIAAEGHALGNHTATHARCDTLTLHGFWAQVERTDRVLAEICPEVERPLFRPPFGVIRAWQVRELHARGRSAALWSVDSRDYRGASAEEIGGLAARLRSGDVALMHDRFPATWAALPRLLDAIEEKGLRAVSLEPSARRMERGEGVRRWSTRGAV